MKIDLSNIPTGWYLQSIERLHVDTKYQDGILSPLNWAVEMRGQKDSIQKILVTGKSLQVAINDVIKCIKECEHGSTDTKR